MAEQHEQPGIADGTALPGKAQVQLHKIPLLAGLGEDDMLRVRAELRIRQYARRDLVLQSGAAGEGLLFLLSGRLQVLDVTEDGRAVGLRTLAPGDFFGEIAVINGAPRAASVVALTPVLVALLPRATALRLFTEAPSVASQMLRFLADKVQRDAEFRALLGIHNAARRICAFLDLLRHKSAAHEDVIDNLPTHQDIASMLNTSRETVTRTLLRLAEQGIIEKGTHRLIILKPEALKSLAQA